MSYDYNSQDGRFDFPNPYRIENIFYLLAAGILVVGGISLLLTARNSIGSGSLLAMSPLAVGVIMLVDGLVYAAIALARLRFFFGRGRPESLAQDLPPDQGGTTPSANALKDLLRHNSLVLQEPLGPLNGALYAVLPNLIFAPPYIQVVAQRQFQNALAILVTLLSLVVSLVGADKATTAWLGAFYFVMALVILLKPLDNGAKGETSLGFRGLVGLILLSILGPVVIPLLTKGITVPTWFPGIGQAAIVMVAAEAAIGLFFLAVLKQTVKSPPSASMAMEQGTLTMNSHPKQVMDELEREMQSQWVASLPNRRYAHLIPDVLLNAQSGTFEGELLEETQPVPNGEMQTLSLQSCFREPRYRWLGWLNCYGLATMLISVIALTIFAKQFYTSDGADTSVVTAATLGVSFWILGKFSFRAGNFLWGRFDFFSKLVWVEMKGNYQAAQMDYGNQFTDRVKTQKQVINIESMTLRVWIAEIETVTFGKDAKRVILGMSGLKNEASALHAHLTHFGQQQSMIVAPTSMADMHRVNALSAMNQIGGKGAAATQALPDAIAHAIETASAPPAGQDASAGPASEVGRPDQSATQAVCGGCEPARLAGAKFCPECGTRLVA